MKSQGDYNTILEVEWTNFVILFKKLESVREMADKKANVYERCVTHEESEFTVKTDTLNGSLLVNSNIYFIAFELGTKL